MLAAMNMRTGLALVFFSLSLHATAASLWTDDYEAARLQAKAENRFLLLDFTGSDWCGWCKKLDAEVFAKGDFKNYAKANLVCVTVDFPRNSTLKKKVAEQNEQLAKTFGVHGYPSIIILDPSGNKLNKVGYQEGGAEKYVELLETIIAPAREKLGLPKTAGPAGPGAAAALPAAAAPAAGAGYRTWTSASGQKLEARVEQRVGTKVYLRNRENKLITIDSTSLSAEDQAFLRDGRPGP